ncbi:MAG: hypothetical protein ACT4OL_09380 [Nitrospiraceae bacterium]
MTCLNCGAEQEEAPECVRCGPVIAKHKTKTVARDSQPQAERTDEPCGAKTWLLGRVFRILPWIFLTITVGLFALVLRPAPPLPIQTDPQVVDHLAEKKRHLEFFMRASQPYTLALNEAELNQLIQENLAPALGRRSRGDGVPSLPSRDAAQQETHSALRDVQVNLLGNQLRAYNLFVLYGKEISLQLDGTLETYGGHLRLKPNAGMLGSLPIPKSMLVRVFHRLFNAPENREKFQLPPQIESVRVENGTLIMSTR